MSRIKRTLALAGLACLSIGCGDSTSGSDSRAAASSQITIASNPPGTNVYAVSAALAKVMQEELGRRTTIRPQSGSSVYIPMLERGDVELGLNTNIDGYLSFRGLPPYTSPMRNLRTLGMMFPLHITFMVRADSGMERIEDLRDKRVVVTIRANAALEQLHRGILATGGLSFDDIDPITVAGVPEGVAALQEGRADAIPIGIGTALGLQADAAIPGGIRYLTMGANEAELPATMPGTRVATMNSGPNTVGIPQAIRVSSVPDMLNTGTHLSDDDAYRIVSLIHANWATLQSDVTLLATVPLSDLAPADNMHPYHPGAVRYLTEAGLWTEAHAENQAELLELATTD